MASKTVIRPIDCKLLFLNVNFKMIHLSFNIPPLAKIDVGKFKFKNRKLLFNATFVMLHVQDKKPSKL